MSELVRITNANLRRKWGWGYSTTPSGRDAWSILPPSGPDHTGTLNQIFKAIETDESWRHLRSGGTLFVTAWFWDGRRILNKAEVEDWLSYHEHRKGTVTVLLDDER